MFQQRKGIGRRQWAQARNESESEAHVASVGRKQPNKTSVGFGPNPTAKVERERDGGGSHMVVGPSAPSLMHLSSHMSLRKLRIRPHELAVTVYPQSLNILSIFRIPLLKLLDCPSHTLQWSWQKPRFFFVREHFAVFDLYMKFKHFVFGLIHYIRNSSLHLKAWKLSQIIKIIESLRISKLIAKYFIRVFRVD